MRDPITELEQPTLPDRPQRSFRPSGLGRLENSVLFWFEDWAKISPNAVALIWGTETWSYQALNAASNRLARHLVQRGVSPGTFVGVCLDRGTDLIMSLLAVFKAGGVYVPLDPAYPDARIGFMVRDASLGFVIARQNFAELFSSPGIEVIPLDQEKPQIELQAAGNLEPSIKGDSLAYVIYTSGTTGSPKGVLLEHRGLVNVAKEQAKWFGAGQGSRVLQFSSPSFDASLFEIVMALTSEAALVLAARDELRPGPSLAKLLREQRITILTIPPSSLAALQPEPLSDLAVLNVAGEACPAALVSKWAPSRMFFNLYGPTECTIWVSAAQCVDDGQPPHIGSGIAGMTLHVLDSEGCSVSPGEMGELWVGGVGLARGYLNRPDLTAERFIPSLQGSQKAGERLYRTGDLARLRPDGHLDFAGRADDQIKLRGYRIELGEIESQIGSHPAVRGVKAILREDLPRDPRLVAYVALAEPSRPLIRELRERLRRVLPAHMIPSSFVVVDHLPLLATGKIDRQALPAPSADGGDFRDFMPPRTPTESAVARIFADLLGLKKVGVLDDFFELGGHSITATQLASRLRDRFRIEVGINRVFELPTPGAMASEIDRLCLEPGASGPVEEIPLRSRGGRAPLSFAQGRVWFLQQLDPGEVAYNYQGGIHFRGRLDVPMLEKSLSEIVRRHEIYRTSFPEVDGQPVQEVQPSWEVRLDPWDLSRLPLEKRQTEAERLIHDEGRKPFDVTRGPLVKWFLLRLSGTHHILAHVDHHLVHDGWSLNVLLKELVALYGAFSAGRASPLHELPIQVSDFAAWQNERMTGSNLDAGLDYWKKQLAGSPGLLELPCDRPRPPRPSSAGALFRSTLDAALSDGLRELSQAAGATLFMSVQGAFAAVLGRYSGQDDLCVGASIANRRWPQAEGLIGMIINNIVLRHDLSGNPTFRELQGRVSKVVRDALKHQDVPFEKIVDAVRPIRSSRHHPLFQVMLSFHDSPRPGLGLPDLNVEHQEVVHNGSAKFDLNIVAIPRREQRVSDRGHDAGGHIDFLWEYNTDLFDRSTVSRIAEHFVRFLEGVVAEPNRPISEIKLLSQAEREQAIVGWNRWEIHPKGACLHERFEERAEAAPESVALVFGDERISYRVLNERANRLAHRLIGLGVTPDQLVGLRLERSMELVVGILAILKSGGAYLPLDPAYPKDRVGFMLEDAGAEWVVTEEAFVPELQSLRARCVLVNDTAADEESNPRSSATADSVAYAIYTSGSTGQPKGALITHHNVARLFEATQGWFQFGSDDVWTLFHSTAFDFSVWELWGALLHGGRLVVVPYWVSRSPEALLDLLSREGVTVLNQTPSAFRSLLRPELLDLPRPPTLRYVIFGGEALDPQILRPWFDRHGDERPLLVNMYGITETTVHVTYRPIRHADLERGHGSFIGVPIPDLQLYILEPGGEPAPIGAPGEIFVGGAGVGRGYLGRPELTRRRFVTNHLIPGKEGLLYRTGDLARRLAGGDIEYLGRLDHQVKIRGFRIELGEVEVAITSVPGVRESVVVMREDQPGDRRLVGYVVFEPGSAGGLGELRERLAQRLPDYMVPSHFVALDQVPLTSNGKIDRRALPAPDATAGLKDSYVAPRTPVELAMANVWAETLGIERVGIHDNFFELGGHSLLAISVLGRMRRAGIHSDLRAFFAAPTVAGLASNLMETSTAVAVPPNRIPAECERIDPDMLPLIALTSSEIDRIVARVEGGVANVQDIYPLAPLQEGMLFHHLLSHQGDPYLLRSLTCFDSRARMDRYIESLQRVIDRHDILRTAVLWEGLPCPVQVVWRFARLPVEEVQVPDGRGDVVAWMKERFDPRSVRLEVRQAPMMRLFIARDQVRDRWVLLQFFHHLVVDHTSMRAVREEIQALLQGRGGSLPTPLPFRHFVAQATLGVSRQEHEAFFREMLGDVVEPTEPFGLSSAMRDGSGIVESRLPVDSSIGARMRVAARSLGVSAASLAHLAWAMVLARASGRSDVVFGTLLFGRLQGGEGSERVLGLFINTLPLRLRLGEDTVRGSVLNAHQCLARLMRHEHAPLALAQRCSAVQAPAPLFTALFNYRHSVSTAVKSPQDELEAWDGIEFLGGEERTNYALAVSVDDFGTGFALTTQCQASLDPKRINRMLHLAFERLVEALQEAPESKISDLDVLDPTERRQLLEEWNPPLALDGRRICLHEWFEEQAVAFPARPAATFEGSSLSYEELDARSNRLARHLRSLGVGPESIVGLCVERSLELVIGVVGILKAGGAYLPLDPGYPPARLSFMLEDSAASALVSLHALEPKLPALPSRRVFLDGPSEPWMAESPARCPDCGAQPDNLAYVIYTSGSTGQPKGVLVTHRQVARLMQRTERCFQFDHRDVWTLFHSFAFDFSVWEIWGALLYGGRLVIVPRETSRSPEAFLALLGLEKVTVLNQTPSAFWQLMQAESSSRQAIELSLRWVIFGGEALEMARLKPWFERHGDDRPRLVNMYGITETTVHVTWRPIHRQDLESASLIGRPIEDLSVHIVDSRGRLAPIGVRGELVVGGDGLSRGYLNRPDLTAERFLPNPYSRKPGGRLYWSGDLARYDQNGDIEHLGRADQQIKIRGHRVELGEIQHALEEYPGVRQTCVRTRLDASGKNSLTAFMVVQGCPPPAPGALRQFLQQRLPEYMVPSRFKFLQTLPLTSNGKIDFQHLDGLECEEARGCPAGETRSSPAEEALAAIWREVLELQNVGSSDNFFELGGHSLTATRLVARVRHRLGVEMSLRDLFAAPTLAALASRLDQLASGVAGAVLAERIEL